MDTVFHTTAQAVETNAREVALLDRTLEWLIQLIGVKGLDVA